MRESTFRDFKDYSSKSVFSWRTDSAIAFSWLIHSLKQKEDSRYWRPFAQWMVENEFPTRASLVPVPSFGKPNHALGFAKAIQECTGWSVLEGLSTEQQGPQKFLRREQRGNRRFSWKGDPPSLGPLILVDDVLTTGATARAVYRALGAPKAFKVWCLLDRRPCEKQLPQL
jgi:predicted amidophosphoribosyltransferase